MAEMQKTSKQVGIRLCHQGASALTLWRGTFVLFEVWKKSEFLIVLLKLLTILIHYFIHMIKVSTMEPAPICYDGDSLCVAS